MATIETIFPAVTAAEAIEADALVAKYIEQHPGKPGAENARVKEHGYSVWILIGALRAANDDLPRVAAGYLLPVDAVRAAVAYYHDHAPAIDQQIDETTAYHEGRL